MKNKYFLFLCGFLLFCSSGFYKKENVYISERLAVYFLNEEDYPDRDLRKYLPPLKSFPENSTENLKVLLKSLYVEKEGIFSKDVFPVFSSPQLDEIFLILKDIIPKIPKGQRVLVVHKFDPYKTVLSKYKRTTFLLWYDENGYNVLFGDIAEDLIPDNYSTEVNWLDIYPISFKQGNPKQKIVGTEQIQYKKIGDFTHYTWITSKWEQITKLKEQFKEQEIPLNSKKQPLNSIEVRLKKLKDLYENKLISESEYETKKKEILKDL
ncbi:MAG: SHOCT domain-containing protein [Leptonema sp. (in: bacteria)]